MVGAASCYLRKNPYIHLRQKKKNKWYFSEFLLKKKVKSHRTNLISSYRIYDSHLLSSHTGSLRNSPSFPVLSHFLFLINSFFSPSVGSRLWNLFLRGSHHKNGSYPVYASALWFSNFVSSTQRLSAAGFKVDSPFCMIVYFSLVLRYRVNCISYLSPPPPRIRLSLFESNRDFMEVFPSPHVSSSRHTHGPFVEIRIFLLIRFKWLFQFLWYCSM